jgi:hypothetical protein
VAVTLTDEQVHNIAASLRQIADVLDPPAQQRQDDPDLADDSQWFASGSG